MNDVTALHRALRRQGWKIELRRNHALAHPPDGATPVLIPGPRANWRGRALKNALAALRRTGQFT